MPDEKKKTSEAPKQPTVHVQQPPKQDTKTVRSNDPVTNEAERRIAEEELGPDDEAAKASQQQQEEEAQHQQELADQRRELMQEILSSPEGYVVGEEGNLEALEEARTQGLVHYYTVQSGKGGLDVEERYEVTGQGYEQLRSVFGQGLGVK